MLNCRCPDVYAFVGRPWQCIESTRNMTSSMIQDQTDVLWNISQHPCLFFIFWAILRNQVHAKKTRKFGGNLCISWYSKKPEVPSCSFLQEDIYWCYLKVTYVLKSPCFIPIIIQKFDIIGLIYSLQNIGIRITNQPQCRNNTPVVVHYVVVHRLIWLMYCMHMTPVYYVTVSKCCDDNS